MHRAPYVSIRGRPRCTTNITLVLCLRSLLKLKFISDLGTSTLGLPVCIINSKLVRSETSETQQWRDSGAPTSPNIKLRPRSACGPPFHTKILFINYCINSNNSRVLKIVCLHFTRPLRFEKL